jgi:hypothetical protein
MVSLTLSVDKDLKNRMDAFPEMNWSAVARNAIIKRLEFMEKLSEFTKNSELTEEDAIRIGRQINAGMAQKFELLVKKNETRDRREHSYVRTDKKRKKP